MPKKFPVVQMREWLRRYEQGQSEASIAKAAHCDVRTLKKGLEVARRERDAGAARAELLKESLRKHQDALMGAIDRLLAGIAMPGSDLAVEMSGDGDPKPVELPIGKATWMPWQGFEVAVDLEESVMWGLLHEHLRRDTMWDYLDRWKKAVALHLEARRDLKTQVIQLLEEMTGLKVVKDGEEGSAKGFIFEAAVDVICRVLFKWAMGSDSEEVLGQEIERRIQRMDVTPNGYVQDRSANPVFAYAPRKGQQRREQIIEALKELQKLPALQTVRDTCKAVDEPSKKASRAREEMSLLGFVPGQCRVCQRLGM